MTYNFQVGVDCGNLRHNRHLTFKLLLRQDHAIPDN
jgi:hypothetical protein